MIGIYKITNKINGLTYIGQSKDIQERLRQHRSISMREDDPHFHTPIHEAIHDYGWENFDIEILLECDENELDIQEQKYIHQFNSFLNGYNDTMGGRKKPVYQYDLEGTMIKMFESATQASRETGISQTDISRVCRGERKSAGGFQWRFVKDNLNIKIEPIKRVRTGEKKIVYQYNSNHELIAVFDGVREAAQQLNINPSNLSAAASGKRKSAGGFLWSYEETSFD